MTTTTETTNASAEPQRQLYRGYEIVYVAPPIAIRSSDWHFAHPDADDCDRREGYGPTPADCREQIDEQVFEAASKLRRRRFVEDLEILEAEAGIGPGDVVRKRGRNDTGVVVGVDAAGCAEVSWDEGLPVTLEPPARLRWSHRDPLGDLLDMLPYPGDGPGGRRRNHAELRSDLFATVIAGDVDELVRAYGVAKQGLRGDGLDVRQIERLALEVEARWWHGHDVIDQAAGPNGSPPPHTASRAEPVAGALAEPIAAALAPFAPAKPLRMAEKVATAEVLEELAESPADAGMRAAREDNRRAAAAEHAEAFDSALERLRLAVEFLTTSTDAHLVGELRGPGLCLEDDQPSLEVVEAIARKIVADDPELEAEAAARLVAIVAGAGWAL